MKNDPLKPSLALLSKLGSIIVHADEALSVKGHALDVEAIRPLISRRRSTAMDQGNGSLSSGEEVIRET